MRPLLTFALFLPLAQAVRAQAPTSFADPARLTKLASGYQAVDSNLSTYAERQHIPGAAWAVVVDGRIAYVGLHGHRDVAAKARSTAAPSCTSPR